MLANVGDVPSLGPRTEACGVFSVNRAAACDKRQSRAQAHVVTIGFLQLMLCELTAFRIAGGESRQRGSKLQSAHGILFLLLRCFVREVRQIASLLDDELT